MTVHGIRRRILQTITLNYVVLMWLKINYLDLLKVIAIENNDIFKNKLFEKEISFQSKFHI